MRKALNFDIATAGETDNGVFWIDYANAKLNSTDDTETKNVATSKHKKREYKHSPKVELKKQDEKTKPQKPRERRPSHIEQVRRNQWLKSKEAKYLAKHDRVKRIKAWQKNIDLLKKHEAKDDKELTTDTSAWKQWEQTRLKNSGNKGRIRDNVYKSQVALWKFKHSPTTKKLNKRLRATTLTKLQNDVTKAKELGFI